MSDAFATTKRAADLKAGDVTPWYIVLEDAEPGTDDDGTCVLVKIEWNDGGRDYRVWSNVNAEVEVRHTLTKAELRKLVSD